TIGLGTETYLSISRMAIDSAGRIAVVGSGHGTNGTNDVSDWVVTVFKANGCPDVDYGMGGVAKTTVAVNPSAYLFNYEDTAAAAAFDSAGQLVVAGTAGQNTAYTDSDFAVVRYLAHDPVVEAGSATFAADLRSAVAALRTTPPPGTPRVVIHVSSPT